MPLEIDNELAGRPGGPDDVAAGKPVFDDVALMMILPVANPVIEV